MVDLIQSNESVHRPGDFPKNLNPLSQELYNQEKEAKQKAESKKRDLLRLHGFKPAEVPEIKVDKILVVGVHSRHIVLLNDGRTVIINKAFGKQDAQDRVERAIQTGRL